MKDDNDICWCGKPKLGHCQAIRRMTGRDFAVDMGCHERAVVDGRYCLNCAREMNLPVRRTALGTYTASPVKP